ncbi:Serine/threonine-protein kinase [Blastocladiella emersonii ATCC 22665]|nr:Serine/threonine-protein kinase [Blastocladiella emersonii ATCC 22665]
MPALVAPRIPPGHPATAGGTPLATTTARRPHMRRASPPLPSSPLSTNAAVAVTTTTSDAVAAAAHCGRRVSLDRPMPLRVEDEEVVSSTDDDDDDLDDDEDDEWDHPFFRPGKLVVERRPVAATTTSAATPASPSRWSLARPKSTTSSAGSPDKTLFASVTRLDQYTFGKTLGQGSMGKVKLATDECGNKFAVKIIPRSGQLTNEDDQTAETRVLREASVLFLLNHPNIVRMADAIVTDTHFYLVMEYVDGPQLLDHVVANGRLPERDAVRLARSLLSAVAYCHAHHIVHRDLKIENILLTRDGHLKLVDFGLSNFYDPASQLHTFCGSLYFASPELISAHPYTGPEVDVWSLGVILYVLVTARVPFDAPTLPQLHARIRRGEVHFPGFLSRELVDLLRRMLTVDPARRIPMADVLAHPWVVGGASPTAPPNAGAILPLAKVPADRAIRAHALARAYGGRPRNHGRFAGSASSFDPADGTESEDEDDDDDLEAHANDLRAQSRDPALGDLHADAMILLTQLTQLPRADLVAGIGDPHHHLHTLQLLVYEWLERAQAPSSAAAANARTAPPSTLFAPSPLAMAAAASAAVAPDAVIGRRRSVAVLASEAVAERRRTRQIQARQLAHQQRTGSDEAIVVSHDSINRPFTLPSPPATLARNQYVPGVSPVLPAAVIARLGVAAPGSTPNGSVSGAIGGSSCSAPNSPMSRASSSAIPWPSPCLTPDSPHSVHARLAGAHPPLGQVLSFAPTPTLAVNSLAAPGSPSIRASPPRAQRGPQQLPPSPARGHRPTPLASSRSSMSVASSATTPTTVLANTPSAATLPRSSTASSYSPTTPAPLTRTKTVVARKPSVQSLFAGSHVITLPSNYAAAAADGGLALADPVARLVEIAKTLHITADGVSPTGAILRHTPSLAQTTRRRPTVCTVKLTRQGLGMLRPCLAFRAKAGGDGDVFRMLVQSLQREWARVHLDQTRGLMLGTAAAEGESVKTVVLNVGGASAASVVRVPASASAASHAGLSAAAAPAHAQQRTSSGLAKSAAAPASSASRASLPQQAAR